MANPQYRIPVIGPWLRRVGQVEDLLAIPCATTPSMWVTGFFNSLPKLLWSLYGPDCIDEVFARAGSPHHKRRRIKFKGITVIEALGDGASLPGYGTFLFEAAEIAQKLGWYMMIVDATTQFAVDWTSAVYQYAGCRPSAGRWMKCESQTIVVVPFPVAQLVHWGRNLEGDGSLLAVGGTGVTAYAPMQSGVAFTLKVDPYPPAPTPVGRVNAWLQDEYGNQFAHTGEIKPDALGNRVGNGFHRFPQPQNISQNYQVWCTCEGGYASLLNSTIAISDASPSPFFPSPCAKILNRSFT